MKFRIYTLLILLVAGISAQAQENPMELFNRMLGKWEGKAEVSGPEGKSTVIQSEEISWKLGGKVLYINGKGTDPASGDQVFEALGLIHWDPSTSGYIFNAYTNEGRYTQASASWEDEKLVWKFDVPNGGTVRYTLLIDGDSWIEDGHFSRDGENWFPFIHMELERK